MQYNDVHNDDQVQYDDQVQNDDQVQYDNQVQNGYQVQNDDQVLNDYQVQNDDPIFLTPFYQGPSYAVYCVVFLIKKGSHFHKQICNIRTL